MVHPRSPSKGGSSTRFKKGQSGNPKGRPRSGPKLAPSAYNIIIDRTITITKDGVAREATVEEALQIKTYQMALAGNPAAEKEVLQMIAKREAYLSRQPSSPSPSSKPAPWEIEQDPDNAFDALLLLDIASPDTRYDNDRRNEYRRILLQPWAVQLALNRRGLNSLSKKEMDDIIRCTSDPDSLTWPRRFT